MPWEDIQFNSDSDSAIMMSMEDIQYRSNCQIDSDGASIMSMGGLPI